MVAELVVEALGGSHLSTFNYTDYFSNIRDCSSCPCVCRLNFWDSVAIFLMTVVVWEFCKFLVFRCAKELKASGFIK